MSEYGSMTVSTGTARPIFMFGFERSGTTLLSMITGAHPSLAVPLSVTGLWYTYARRLANYGDLGEDTNLERLVADLLREERIRLWDEPIDQELVMAELDRRDYPSVIAAFHRAYARRKGKPCWANLDIGTLDDMDLAYRWFPNAKFVHIVRDGRDVALSHETMPYGAANVLDCAQSWVQRLHLNFKMGAMLAENRYCVVRYEDLILDTEHSLVRLCDFLELDYSPRMMDYGMMVDKKIPEEKRWLWPALGEAPQKSKCYQWRKRMSASKRAVFEGEARDMLSKLNYETLDEAPRNTGAYALEMWCLLGRHGRFRRLKRKLGLSRPSQLQREWKKAHEQ